MKAHSVTALHFIDNGVNAPHEFLIAVVDAEGTLHQSSGTDPILADLLNSLVSTVNSSDG